MTEKLRKKLEIPQKTSKEYVCTSCDFKTHNKYDYNRHLYTRKHKAITNDKYVLFHTNIENYICECGSMYKYLSGLSRHKRNCPIFQNVSQNKTEIENKYSKAFNTVIAENAELRCLLIEPQKQITKLIDKAGPIKNTTNNNINNINTTNHFI